MVWPVVVPGGLARPSPEPQEVWPPDDHVCLRARAQGQGAGTALITNIEPAGLRGLRCMLMALCGKPDRILQLI